MNKFLVLFGLGLLMLMTLPSRSLAAPASVHYFDCKQCHKSGMAIGTMGGNNTCLECHSLSANITKPAAPNPAKYDGKPGGRFSPTYISDLFGAATAGLGTGTYIGQTHAWGVADVPA